MLTLQSFKIICIIIAGVTDPKSKDNTEHPLLDPL